MPLKAFTTPKAFTNFSPGLLQPWVNLQNETTTLKALAIVLVANAFSVAYCEVVIVPGLKQPRAEFSKRLRRYLMRIRLPPHPTTRTSHNTRIGPVECQTSRHLCLQLSFTHTPILSW